MSESTVDAIRNEYMPDMPPIERGRYLIELLLEIGPTMAGSMGSAPLTYGEIESWQALTGASLWPWESRLLRRLSSEYLAESIRAEKRDAVAPWVVERADTREVAKSMQKAILELTKL